MEASAKIAYARAIHEEQQKMLTDLESDFVTLSSLFAKASMSETE